MNMASEVNVVSTNRRAARRDRYLFVRAVLLLLAAALSSCAPKGVQVRPPVTIPRSFSAEGTAAMPPKWWTAFDDGQLNLLIDEALRGNFSLRVAWDRLDQSRAAASQGGALLWPDVDGSAGVSRTVRRTAARGRTYTTDYSLGVAAGYELDLWGRVRSTYDAARLDAYATNEDLHSAAITLTARIARTWYTLIEQRGQLALLDQQIKTNSEYLEIITLRFRRGHGSATDVLQQRQLIESTKGDRVLVESAIEVLRHQLAVLLGRAPSGAAVGAPGKLPSLPALPRTGVPAEWIRRRPDVRAAELRVQAADRRVAAAIADRFPRLGLTARAETTAERVRDLFDNWLASLAADLVAPLFDGGRRRAEVERTRAAVSEQLNSYGHVVLSSLSEVEDALSQEAKQDEYVVSLGRQLDLSERATTQTLENYTKATTDFTRYLTTLLSHQRLQRTHLQARRQLVGFRIDLCRALAGSWTLPRPPRAKVSGPRESVKNPTDEEDNAAAR